MERVPRHPGRTGGQEEDILQLCREELARWLKVENSRQIVLCKNATEALNIAILGLGLKSGDSVVTTAAEHNSVLRPLYRLEKNAGIRLRIVDCDSQGRVDSHLWKEVIDRLAPRLVVLNHASNVTGAVNPASLLLSYAREQGCVTLLDASQTLGLLDINAVEMAADMIAFTGHKYLLGPTGTGGLYVREGLDLEPVFVGGTGVRSDLKEMPPEMPGKLEPGTPPIPLFAGLLHSLQWSQKHPHSLQELEMLTYNLEQGLEDRGAEVIHSGKERTFIISFLLPGWDLKESGYILENSFNILCRTGLHCAPLIHRFIGTAPLGTVRFSLSRFTHAEDVVTILTVIEQLMKHT